MGHLVWGHIYSLCVISSIVCRVHGLYFEKCVKVFIKLGNDEKKGKRVCCRWHISPVWANSYVRI